ncbi:anthranilate phosphoribosyltransferase [Glaciecola sp. 1036]|uniref:anthranilate phosphoribosyltransferase n=1 Tax=Alteromonadaceae TaxID=72275 RepID=UPI003D02E8EC
MDKQTLLESIYSHQDLDLAQAEFLFGQVMQGNFSEIEITALLVGLKTKGESESEIAGAASAMINHAKVFPRPDYAFSDIVGTGGDGHNTINISSAAALVAAACGVKVAKHGNKSVSSKSGSSDLFASFGLNLMMSPEVARKCLDEANFCFLAAPNYHAGVGHVMPVRNALKTRTVFNILGPLANPAKPTHGVYGVYTLGLLPVYADVLSALGHKNALVVHGAGLDEIAIHGPTTAMQIKNGDIQPITLTAKDFGAQEAHLVDIQGGLPDENKGLIEKALLGKGKKAHMDAIAVNAAALLWVNEKADSLADCYDMAMTSMMSGAPLEVIQKAASISTESAS